ncbi:MAG: hypothetical protein JW718_07815 [Desulfovibrionaceae bacterium]|nr:hypothetical protein [Desulfovibrionaceae bacterium]
MSQLLGVKFNDYGQIYLYSSGPFVVGKGQSVIVKTEQGMSLGRVVLIREDPSQDEGGQDQHKSIYRLANEGDLQTMDENRELAARAFEFCRRCVEDHELAMKLVDVEVLFDRGKMVFYFTAPGRIDFRELIKDLVKEYRTRIELRQIGVRHETQMIGAMGSCGQVCCCRRFMRRFVPVTIKMAKEQNLFLNPAKISGICGRLLCCLSFEQGGYEDFNRKCPKIGKRYQTSMGPLKVLRSNFFRKTLSVLLEDGEEREIPVEDWPGLIGEPSAGPSAKDSPERDRPEVEAPPARDEALDTALEAAPEAAGAEPPSKTRPKPRKRRRKAKSARKG